MRSRPGKMPPAFLALTAAKAGSEIGDQFALIAVGLALYDATGDIGWLAGMWAAKAAVRLFIQPFAGTLVDRRPLRTVIAATAAAQTAVALAMAVTGGGYPGVLLALVTVAQLLQVFDGPAVSKAVPRLLPRELLLRGNALFRAALTTAAVLGPALGGVIYAQAGPAILFAANAGSFLLYLFCVLTLRIDAVHDRTDGRRFFVDVVDGLRYAMSHRLVAVVMVLAFADSAVWRAVEIVNVPASEELFGYGSEGLGLSYTLLVAGGVVGALLLVRYPRLAETPLRAISSYTLLGAPLVAMYLWPVPLVAYCALAACGLLLEWFGIGMRTLLQLSVDERYQGRVFALHGCALSAGALPLALGIQPLVGAVGLRGVYVLSGIAVVLSGVLAHSVLRTRSGPLDRVVRSAAVPAKEAA